MMPQPTTRTVLYQDDGVTLSGFLALPAETGTAPRPAVLVFPDWSGCNEFAKNKAKALVELGYIAFAADVYGDGRVGTTDDEKMELLQPLMGDRALLRARVLAAFEAIAKLPEVDTQKIVAIGFCFGGLCALDLARAGAPLKGAVSFHGLLHPLPSTLPLAPIHAKLLVLHGFADPSVPPDAVLAFTKEMDEAKVDWQIHLYGGVVHAFTNPQAHVVALGRVYHAAADQRSWIALKNFLEELYLA